MMDTYGSALRLVEHVDAVPYAEVPALFAQASIAVFPSAWENFPNVCLEGMVAARAVIGSSAGGMAEMIDDGRTGLLVPPRNPRAIADALIRLLRDPGSLAQLGLAARTHVLATYGCNPVGPLQENALTRAIENMRLRAHAYSA